MYLEHRLLPVCSKQNTVVLVVSPVGNVNCRGQTNEGFFICCATGYTARAGWDPATGLGSLNFGNFRDYVMGLTWSSAGPPAPPWAMPAPTASAASALLCPVAPVPYLGTCTAGGGGGTGEIVGVVVGTIVGVGATAAVLFVRYDAVFCCLYVAELSCAA